MFFYILLLVLKIAFVLFGICAGGLAYSEISEWNELRSQQTIIMYYDMDDGTSSSPPEIVVELPKCWRPGQSQLVKYEAVSLGSPSEEITLTLHSGQVFTAFGTPITFSLQSPTVITREVTVSPSAIQNRSSLLHYQVITEIELPNSVGLTEPTYVTVVTSRVLWWTGIRATIITLICLVIMVIAALFVIFVW
jgi:hypothetical protein